MLFESDSNHLYNSTDRRSMPRLSTSGEPARIAWRQLRFPVCKAPAELVDINAKGEGLFAAQRAEPGAVIWLGLMSLPREWVKATILETYPDCRRWRLHIAFREPCPVGLLEQALGLSERPRKVPSFRFFWDDEIEIQEDTCATTQLL